MKKKLFVSVVTILVLLAQVTLARADIIRESWYRVQATLDCDGVPLVVDANVQDVSSQCRLCEYHAQPFTHDEINRCVQDIMWDAFDLDINECSYTEATKSHLVGGYLGRDVYPMATIDSVGNLIVRNCNLDYIYHTNQLSTYDVDFSPLGQLTQNTVEQLALEIATVCGFQVGEAVRMHRVNDVDVVRESIAKTNHMTGTMELTDARFMDVVFPIYINGMRLYSGPYDCTADNLDIPNMNMQLFLSAGKELLGANIMLPKKMTVSQEFGGARVLTGDEAIECIRDKYSMMFLQGVKEIRLHQLSLEYVAITGDPSAKKGYTLYPAWVARITLCLDGDERMDIFEAYHAITGVPLF